MKPTLIGVVCVCIAFDTQTHRFLSPEVILHTLLHRKPASKSEYWHSMHGKVLSPAATVGKCESRNTNARNKIKMKRNKKRREWMILRREITTKSRERELMDISLIQWFDTRTRERELRYSFSNGILFMCWNWFPRLLSKSTT